MYLKDIYKPKSQFFVLVNRNNETKTSKTTKCIMHLLGLPGLSCVAYVMLTSVCLAGRRESREKNQPVDRIKTGTTLPCQRNLSLSRGPELGRGLKKLDDESLLQPISVELVIERSIPIGRGRSARRLGGHLGRGSRRRVGADERQAKPVVCLYWEWRLQQKTRDQRVPSRKRR